MSIQIVEVSLRDGLQNESMPISVADRVRLAELLMQAGLRRMELGAFVRPDRIPQMAGSKDVIDQVFAEVNAHGAVTNTAADFEFSALVPNVKGLEEALKTEIKEVAFFTGASESFTKANINCTIDESFKRLDEIMALAKARGLKVRGYLSTCFGCPYEGPVDEAKVAELALHLYEAGCYEVSIGDTIGVANPVQVERLFQSFLKKIPATALAGHFHDTRGTALANILKAYECGIRIFDASLGGLGGCPYAPGASGNVATEDVVYMFEAMGVSTGVDLRQLIQINHWFSGVMGKKLPAKTSQAGIPKGFSS